MLNYLIRRSLVGLLTLTLITFVVYALIRNMPGTPLTLNTAESDPSRQISKDDLKRLQAIYGLDRPWHEAYLLWVSNLLKGDLGRSFHEKKPVTQVIGHRIGPTLMLSLTSLAISYIVAVPLGLYSTAQSGRLPERILSVLLFMLYSVPSFVAALLLLVLFYIRLGGTMFELKPGMVSANYAEMAFPERVLDVLRHMLLPVFCYTYGSLAYLSRFVKSNMEEVVRQDYIRTARAKGVGPVRVIVSHGFRNTLIPFVTLIGLTLPGLLGGSVLLEYIFDWPGMGQLFFEAISNRDYPVLMGETLMFSAMTLAGQLLADVLYAIVDPRVSYN